MNEGFWQHGKLAKHSMSQLRKIQRNLPRGFSLIAVNSSLVRRRHLRVNSAQSRLAACEDPSLGYILPTVSKCDGAVPPILILRNAGAKSADRVEDLARYEHVPSTRKSLLLNVALKIKGKDLFEGLDTRRVVSVDDIDVHTATNHICCGESRNSTREPVGRRTAVRIDERKVTPAGCSYSRVPRFRRALNGRGHNVGHATANFPNRGNAAARVIVDDNDLKLVLWHGLHGQKREAPPQIFQIIDVRDNDGDRNSVASPTAFRSAHQIGADVVLKTRPNCVCQFALRLRAVDTGDQHTVV